jgi:hypothetical protein
VSLVHTWLSTSQHCPPLTSCTHGLLIWLMFSFSSKCPRLDNHIVLSINHILSWNHTSAQAHTPGKSLVLTWFVLLVHQCKDSANTESTCSCSA